MRYYRGRFPPVMLPVFNQAQYAEGLRAQIRALEAQLVQLDGQLATEKRAPPNAYQLRSSAGAILDVVEQMRPSGITLVSMLQVALAVAAEQPPPQPQIGFDLSNGDEHSSIVNLGTAVLRRLRGVASQGDRFVSMSDGSVQSIGRAAGPGAGRILEVHETGADLFVLVQFWEEVRRPLISPGVVLQP